jgi:hypothetical protein
MQRILIILHFLMVLIVYLNCTSSKTFLLEQPIEGKSIIIGAVCVENVGIEDVYEAKTSNITVVIVGKFIDEGKEQIKGFRVRTDKNGYFALQNVSPGSYVVKGIEVDLAYATHLLLSSRWEGNTQIFYPVDTMIDYVVSVWPPGKTDKTINMDIWYFKIDAAFRVFDQVFRSLENKRVSLEEVSHNMPNPLIYFKRKYPDSAWFD